MTIFSYFNPYEGTNFLSFFSQFFIRLFGLITGSLPFSAITTDELQILVLASVAISSAIIGTYLILRKMSMLANALSHTILLGIVCTYLFTSSAFLLESSTFNVQALVIASLITGILTTFLTEFMHKVIRLQEDASIGIVFTSLFALGIVLVTVLTRNLHIGIEVVMGNVDALHLDDLKLVGIVLILNILLISIFSKEFKITTFDPALAKTFGISTIFFHYLLMSQVSATTIAAFRAVGVLMVLAFITGPPLSARLFTHTLKGLIWGSVALGVLASLVGVAMSRHLLTTYGLALSTSGIVVCVIALFFLGCLTIKLIQSWLIKRAYVKKT